LAASFPDLLVGGAHIQHFALRRVRQPEHLAYVLGHLAEACITLPLRRFGPFLLRQQAPLLQHLPGRWPEPHHAVLEEVVVRSGAHGFYGNIFSDGAGYEDERYVESPAAHELERFDTGEAG